MKKIFTVCLLFIGLTMFSQEDKTTVNQTLINQAKEIVTENVDMAEALNQAKGIATENVDMAETLSQVNTIKELFIHYTKEVVEGSKTLIGSGVQLVEQAVDLLYKESTIVVRQFIIYTSISFGILILLGLFLIFWLPKIIKRNLSMDTEKAEAYNLKVDEANDGSIYFKSEKKLSYLGAYYKDKFTLISSGVGTYLGYALGLYLVAFNIMPFIKVTFFSKLYLVEMLLKYIQ